MAKGFKRKGKFRPTGNKKKKSNISKSTTVFGVKLFQKEPVDPKKAVSSINSNLKTRQSLKEKNTMLVSEIEDNPNSEFNIPRRNKLQKNNAEIKRLDKDTKNNFNSLSKEQKQKLPIETKSQLRTL